MQANTLEYFAPKKAPDRWRGVLLVWVFGPLAGAAIGIAQTSAAVFCWVANGKPFFYFDDWSGVGSAYQICGVGGGVVGCLFGLTLFGFERLFKRRIRLAIALPVLVVFGFLIGLWVAVTEFRGHEMRGPVWVECGLFLMGWVVSGVCSRGVSAVAVDVARFDRPFGEAADESPSGTAR